MKDASELVDALTTAHSGHQPLRDVIDAYEAEMIPRGATEVGLTRELMETRAASGKGARYEADLVQLGLSQPKARV